MDAFLKGTGVQVEFAINGREAVDKFRSGSYDLILMDMMMPVLSGEEANQGDSRTGASRGSRPHSRGGPHRQCSR